MHFIFRLSGFLWIFIGNFYILFKTSC